jgi:hypothetical protein
MRKNSINDQIKSQKENNAEDSHDEDKFLNDVHASIERNKEALEALKKYDQEI